MLSDTDVARIEAASELATRNARAAVVTSEKTREELMKRMNHLEGLVATQAGQINGLTGKYNALLGARFDGKSTTSGQ